MVVLCCLIVGSSDLEASPSAGKNTWIVSVPCQAWKCAPTALSSGVNISEVPWYHLLRQMCFQWASQKLHQWLVSHELTAYLSVVNQFLTQWMMTTLSKGCKAYNCEPHNSLKHSFTNIWGLLSSFVECESFPWMKLSWHACSMWGKLGWLYWF